MTDNSNPSLADVYRNDVIESCHRGSVLVMDRSGSVVFSLGDSERWIFPRSAIKFFVSIPLVESGAVDQYGMSDAELSLACASHNAEPAHVEAVSNWLSRMDLGENNLENGPASPGLEEAMIAFYQSGNTSTRLHHNCSGKHTGMMTLARHIGASIEGYSKHDHPTQRSWMAALSELSDIDVSALKWERDGCGLPAVCMPVRSLALACARFADPRGLSEQRSRTIRRISQALTDHPFMMAGSKRCCSDIISNSGGRILAKTGAEGVYTAFVREMGLGVVLKIDDGATRGSEVALGAVLRHIGAITQDEYDGLRHQFNPDVENSQGWVTGQIRPSSIWDQLPEL